jgi:DNA (cytosine-5)-methyltransferase 1
MTGKKTIKKATLTTLRGATFIDLFSGCGGLSLGLVMAGLEGRFAIERDSMAFETFKENFLNGHRLPVKPFTWPYWLKKKNWSVDDLLKEHLRELRALAGEVEVLAGGPPCQGFSFAGKRNESDPRNQLFQKYVDVVNAVQPKALILENVPGMKVAHAPKGEGQPSCRDAPESYYEKLKAQLEGIGYDVTGKLVDASRFGVPQKRVRLIVIGLRRDVSKRLVGGAERVFDILESSRLGVLKDLGLPETVSAR